MMPTVEQLQKVIEMERRARLEHETALKLDIELLNTLNHQLKEELAREKAYHAEDILNYHIAIEQRDTAERERDEALTLLRAVAFGPLSGLDEYWVECTFGKAWLARLDALLAKGGGA